MFLTLSLTFLSVTRRFSRCKSSVSLISGPLWAIPIISGPGPFVKVVGGKGVEVQLTLEVDSVIKLSFVF